MPGSHLKVLWLYSEVFSQPLSPLNARLSAYLATAQAESETAYADMQSAYAFWRDLVPAQPESGEVSFHSCGDVLQRTQSTAFSCSLW